VAFVKPDPAASADLIASIQALVAADRGSPLPLAGFAVAMCGAEGAPPMARMVRERGITIPVVSLTSAGMPRSYRISPFVRNTVVVYRDRKVVANFTDVNRASFPRVAAAVARLIAAMHAQHRSSPASPGPG
jgi:hypothetical protein